MRKLSVLAVPSAVALALVSFASAAQDLPKSATAKKPVASSTSAKAAKPTQAADRSIGASTKGSAERLGGKQGAASADHLIPAASSGGCHGNVSDA